MNRAKESQISSLTILSILTLDRTEELRMILNENLFIVRMGDRLLKVALHKDIDPYVYLTQCYDVIEYLHIVDDCRLIKSWQSSFIAYMDNEISREELMTRMYGDEGLISDLKDCDSIGITHLNDIRNML